MSRQLTEAWAKRLERWFCTLALRPRALFRRRQFDHELDEELPDHIERQIAEHVANGLTREQARTIVLHRFGGLERRKEECRDMRRVNAIEDLWKDLRHTMRVLGRNPGFTAIAILSIRAYPPLSVSPPLAHGGIDHDTTPEI